MLSLDRILKVAQFNEEYGYYSPTMEQHTRRQPAMTFDDWKATLLPLGWVVEGSRYLCSPMGPKCCELIIEQDGEDLGIYLPGQTLRMPPDLATMRALMTGLQIPTNTTGGQGESNE